MRLRLRALCVGFFLVTMAGCEEPEEKTAAPEDPFSVGERCTSGVTWTPGSSASRGMNPGEACVVCHAEDPNGIAPLLLFAGTVYETAHEPDDCGGGPLHEEEKAWIEVTDKKGLILNAPVIENGNFYFFAATAKIELPYTVRVIKNGYPRPMIGAATSGDCNGCHTQAGTEGAPGRVVLP